MSEAVPTVDLSGLTSDGARRFAAALIAQGRAQERADVQAYLARKRTNAEAMLRQSPQFAEEARWSIRQLDIYAEDLRGGLHFDAAATGAAIATGEGV